MKEMLIIAGMHRSGTSLLTQLCERMGAYLGNALIPADPDDNADGYFEDARLIRYHEDIFHGCFLMRSDAIDLLPDAWELHKDVRALAPALKAVLKEGLSAGKLYVVKDPRICRMLPSWRAVLIGLNVTPSYALPFRNPHEVVASLERRHPGLYSAEHRLIWWLLHVLEAERATRGAPRIFISYDTLIESPRNVEKALRTLPVRWPDDSAVIGGLVKPGLRHHVKVKPSSTDAALNKMAQDVYAELLKSDMKDRVSRKLFDAVYAQLIHRMKPQQDQITRLRLALGRSI